VEASTGSLGQGLSMACGMALGLRLSMSAARVFALIGDGESQEGQIWEAAMTAGFRQLDNLCVFLDYNDLQIDGRVSAIKDIAPLRDKWQAFRWRVEEIDGWKYAELDSTGLYYRVDELISADRAVANVERKERSLEDYLEEHKELKEQLEEVWEKGTDQSCEGGG